MRVVVVKIASSRTGAPTRREERLEVAVLTIGRSPDSHVVLSGLRVSLHHARITEVMNELIVEGRDDARVRINGRRVARGAVVPGDVIGIGRSTLRLARPGDDEDLHVEIVEGVVRGGERKRLDERTQLGVESGWLTKRRLSWTLAGLLLLVFGSLPLATGWLLPSWSSGEIARKHAFIADDCLACHARPFRRVANAECVACHEETGHHTPEAVRPAELSVFRCAACHSEHNAGETLVATGSTLCLDCHMQIDAIAPGTKLANVSDFGIDHPEFRLSLVTQPGRRAPERTLAGSDARERSGVRFNHLRHVGQLVSLPEGGKGSLDCGRCHELDAGASHLEPVEFERDCRDCHQLTFDLAVPDRQAFHGEPAVLRDELRSFYSARVLAGRVTDPGAPSAVRFMRPGRTMTKQEESVVSRWVDAQVARAESHLTEKPGECASCHELVAGGASDGGFGVAPVEIAEIWLPKADFSHSTHASFQCRGCHPAAAAYDPEDAPDVARPEWSMPDARPYGLVSLQRLEAEGIEASRTAEDVLIPGRDSCRSCHQGPELGSATVPSECGLCHPFHRAEHGPMRTAAESP